MRGVVLPLGGRGPSPQGAGPTATRRWIRRPQGPRPFRSWHGTCSSPGRQVTAGVLASGTDRWAAALWAGMARPGVRPRCAGLAGPAWSRGTGASPGPAVRPLPALDPGSEGRRRPGVQRGRP